MAPLFVPTITDSTGASAVSSWRVSLLFIIKASLPGAALLNLSARVRGGDQFRVGMGVHIIIGLLKKAFALFVIAIALLLVVKNYSALL